MLAFQKKNGVKKVHLNTQYSFRGPKIAEIAHKYCNSFISQKEKYAIQEKNNINFTY